MVSIIDLEFDINPIKKATNERQIEHWFESLFDKMELVYQSQQRVLQGKSDCLIGDIIIDFKCNINDSHLDEWVNSNGKQYLQEYFNSHGKNPSLLIIISEKFILYYDQELNLKSKRAVSIPTIISLIECFIIPKEINSEQFAILFGANSPLYILCYALLEKHFNEKKSEKSVYFQQWKNHFRFAYHDKEVGKELFLKHSYLAMLLKLILYKEFMNPEEYSKDYFKDLENYFERKGISLFHYDFFHWVINVQGLCVDLFEKLKILKFKATDIFRIIYQEMITAGIRHTLGEYYTPEILCKKMVEKSYVIGERVLDSSCGSGTFLLEIYKKIDSHFRIKNTEKPPKEWFHAVNNIFGFDINPIAVLTSQANILLYFKNLKQCLEEISINVYLCNSIDPIESSPITDIELGTSNKNRLDLTDTQLELRIPMELLLKQKMDLILTNPPWLTYKDADPKLQTNMKKLLKQFNILPGAKDITNIEEAVVFLNKIPNLYLKNDGNGKIAFIMPRSLLVSSQNDKARRFDNFSNIEVFEFNGLIFNVDCCCIFAKYVDHSSDIDDVLDKYPISCYYLDANSMELIKNYELEPYVYFQERRNEKYLVKKLISLDKKKILLPFTMSDYYNDFLQGADLIPKSLLHCKILEKTQDGKIATIEPWISPKAKSPWNKAYYKPQRVEYENIFNATLSRELYPFLIKPLPIFLPLDKDFEYNPNEIGSFSRKHWNFIKEIFYDETQKDLFEVGINFRNKLCINNKVKDVQRKPYKVVFPTSKNLMSAVLDDPEGRTFVDSTIYYYGTEDEDEAFYLCAMFNVPDLFTSVKTIADTRHHHKRPLYFNIPRYNGSQEQKKLAKLAKECKIIVEKYITTTNKIKMQEISVLIKDNLKKIKNIGLNILLSREGKKVIKEYDLEA